MTTRTVRLAEMRARIQHGAGRWRLRAMRASLAIQAAMLALWLVRIAFRAREMQRTSRADVLPTEA